MLTGKQRISLAAALLFVVALALTANVRYTGSDPRGSLLLSEAMLTSGTLKLDQFGEELLQDYGYVVHRKDDHYYYFFPIGSSLVAMPVVAAARVLGVDVRDSEGKLQEITVALWAALFLFISIRLANRFVGFNHAVLVSLVFWTGSSLASTGGTALWSHNFASLFALIAIFLAIDGARKERFYTLGIALSLFFAYLCRPTLALLSPFLLLFLLTCDRRAALKSAGLLAVCLAGFVAVSWLEFRQWLPDYYIPGRLQGGDFVTALAGNTISPARGVLVYSPFLVVLLLRWFYGSTNIPLKRSWLLLALAWPLTHLVVVSRFPHWWGGHAYGPRFMMDVMPGLFLLGVHLWPADSTRGKERPLKIALWVSALFAVYVNAYQGLYNKYTARWNGSPSVNFYPHYLFDWRYPQFLHSEAAHADRLEEHGRRFNLTGVIRDIGPADESVSYFGWAGVTGVQRWNQSLTPAIQFAMPAGERMEGILTLVASYLAFTDHGEEVAVEISLNGYSLGTFRAQSYELPRTFSFDPQILRQDENRLEFVLDPSTLTRPRSKWLMALRHITIK